MGGYRFFHSANIRARDDIKRKFLAFDWRPSSKVSIAILKPMAFVKLNSHSIQLAFTRSHGYLLGSNQVVDWQSH